MSSKSVRDRQRARHKLKRAKKLPLPSPPPPPPRGAKAEPWPPGQSGNPAGYSRGRRAEARLMRLIASRNAGLPGGENYSDEMLGAMLLSGMLTGNIRLFRFGLALLEDDGA